MKNVHYIYICVVNGHRLSSSEAFTLHCELWRLRLHQTTLYVGKKTTNATRIITMPTNGKGFSGKKIVNMNIDRDCLLTTPKVKIGWVELIGRCVCTQILFHFEQEKELKYMLCAIVWPFTNACQVIGVPFISFFVRVCVCVCVWTTKCAFLVGFFLSPQDNYN